MPSALLVEKFKKKSPSKAPKFADEGAPEGDSAQGAGMGPEDAMGPAETDEEQMGGGGMGEKERALDDLADVLGVAPDDREDFANAMAAYVGATLAETMGGAQDEDIPPAPVAGAPPEM